MCHCLIQHGICLTGVVFSTLLQIQDQPSCQTYVYKKVGDLEIKADVYQYDDEKVRPAVLWIHGGALINGHRGAINARVRKMAVDYGYVLISIDYRLAPETKLPDIIEDVEDAFQWVRDDGPELFFVDPERIAAAGASAGGYLTLTSGFRVNPRPRVLLSLWGYGDLVGDWYSKPSRHPRHLRTKLDREQAWQQVRGSPISDARLRAGDGGAFYQFCRQHGEWPRAVSGWDPISETKKFVPFMPVQNIDRNYPPTVLIHGTRDTDVPHEQSVMMARELQKHDVEHELLSIAGGEHGLVGSNRKDIQAAYRRVFEFMKQHLEK